MQRLPPLDVAFDPQGMARNLPVTRRVMARQKLTVAEHQRRLAAGTAGWATDAPGRPLLVPMIIDWASGCKLCDLDGNRYVDLTMGVWTALLGHSPDVVVEAVRAEISRGTTVGVGHNLETELVEFLIDNVECAELGFLSNSGTEAVMQAVKLARASTRRRKIAKFARHYHGHHNEVLVDIDGFGPGVPPQPDTLVLPRTGESFELLRKHRDEVACVLIEPAAPARESESTYQLEFFAELRKQTEELGIVLVFDEVFWGFRLRCGATLDEQGIFPDVACFGKIIAGGMPLGAVVGRREIMRHGMTSGNFVRDGETRVPLLGTCSGNRIACAAGIAQLRYIKEHEAEIYPYMSEKAEWLANEIRAHAASRGLPVQVNVKGGLVTPRVLAGPGDDQPVNQHAQALIGVYLREHGVFYAGGFPIQITPAHRQEDLDAVSLAFRASLDGLLEDGIIAAAAGRA